MNELKHLAIIMDGNGRWAESHGLNRTDGHKMGVNVVREITIWCAKNGLQNLSLYAFSTENWSRPKLEVEFLMKLLERYLIAEEATYMQNNIRFRVIGDIESFSAKLKSLIYDLENKTAKNTAMTQILALNYGSKDEISRAIVKMLPKIAQDSQRFLQDFSKDSALNLLESSLDTAGIPSVDLLIRTGGEMRLSNFLLWQCAYAELFFSPTLFPDFTTAELQKIIEDFKVRNRRFGGI